jgi:hypothetical protein
MITRTYDQLQKEYDDKLKKLKSEYGKKKNNKNKLK